MASSERSERAQSGAIAPANRIPKLDRRPPRRTSVCVAKFLIWRPPELPQQDYNSVSRSHNRISPTLAPRAPLSARAGRGLTAWRRVPGIHLDSAQKGTYALGLPSPGPVGASVREKPYATRLVATAFGRSPAGFPQHRSSRGCATRVSARAQEPRGSAGSMPASKQRSGFSEYVYVHRQRPGGRGQRPLAHH